MRKAILASALAAVALAGAYGGAAPSDLCHNGEVPPATTPLGIGIDQFGDPATGPAGIRACNDGTTVPSPAKGAATLRGDAEGQTAYVEADGDPDNSALPCTDGFVRIVIDANGPHFYQSPDGSFVDTRPGTPGNQTAQEESPDQFVQNVAANCSV